VEQVVAVAATFVPVWEEAAGIVSRLEVLAGFADLAA